MFLAFKLSDIITVPFGYLLDWLYRLTANYGWALVIFAVLIKLILLPINAKSKRSSMKMSRMSPRIQAIQKKYANDQQKQADAIRQLYKDEGVSMGGGCLWAFVPLLILFPLYEVIREPISYILHDAANAGKIMEALGVKSQLDAAPLIAGNKEVLRALGIGEATLKGVNFSFLGINLGEIPDFKIWAWSKFDWAHIGAFLIPVLSAGSQVLAMWVSMRMNNSVVTNEKGIQDEETAKNSEANKTGKTMMWMMPIMSLVIGFTLVGALSLYWLIQGLVSIVIDIYLTKKYRKIYDEEDAIRLQRALEEEALEAEKERIRAERRAANPDGITANTSKKKLQQQQQKDKAAAKEAAAKEYAAKKGIVEEEDGQSAPLSGDPARPYSKGRAYDPNRYSSQTEE